MGASIAFHLAEAGVTDVLLLERGALGGGSTVKAAGGVRAQFSDPVNIALGMRGLDAFEDFPNRPGQEIDLHQPGYLFLLTDPDQVRVYEESVALQNAMGVPSRMLSAEEAKALSPAIDITDVLAAAFHARDGYCSPESVVLGYADRRTTARRHGAHRRRRHGDPRRRRMHRGRADRSRRGAHRQRRLRGGRVVEADRRDGRRRPADRAAAPADPRHRAAVRRAGARSSRRTCR